LWGKCPHCLRIQADGRQIGPEYAATQRKLLEAYLLKDQIAELPIGQIRRSDCIDFCPHLFYWSFAALCHRDQPDYCEEHGLNHGAVESESFSNVL